MDNTVFSYLIMYIILLEIQEIEVLIIIFLYRKQSKKICKMASQTTYVKISPHLNKTQKVQSLLNISLFPYIENLILEALYVCTGMEICMCNMALNLMIIHSCSYDYTSVTITITIIHSRSMDSCAFSPVKLRPPLHVIIA